MIELKLSNGKKERLLFSRTKLAHGSVKIGLNLSGIKTRILNLSSIDFY